MADKRVKYAVAGIMDQTIGYLTSSDVADAQKTIRHPEAHLWDDLVEASMACADIAVRHALYLKSEVHQEKFDIILSDDRIQKVCTYWVEAVEDEEEFRAREDTW